MPLASACQEGPEWCSLGSPQAGNLEGISSSPITSGIFSWWELASKWGRWREKGVVQGTSGGDWVPLPWVQHFNHLLSFQLLTPVPGKEASSFLEGEEQACKQPGETTRDQMQKQWLLPGKAMQFWLSLLEKKKKTYYGLMPHFIQKWIKSGFHLG